MMARKAIHYLSAIFLAVFAAAAPAAESERGASAAAEVKNLSTYSFTDSLKVDKYELPNGMKVILMADRSAPIITHQVWFAVGSRFEQRGATGLAHLFEHLMFKGTPSSPAGKFDRLIEENGGELNAATWVDWTFYYEKIGSDKLDMVIGIEADRMKNIAFTQESFDTERQVVINERRFRVEDSVVGRMREKLYALAFRAHPYGWPTIGFKEDLEGVTLEEAAKFYSTYYSPNNAVCVIVGDFDEKKTLESVAKSYGSIPASKLPRLEAPEEPPQESERRARIEAPVTAEKAVLGYRIPPQDHKDFYALEALDEIAFSGSSSRLYRSLVSEGQIAAQVSGWPMPTVDPSLFEVLISMKEGHSFTEAERVLDRELAVIARWGVSGGELEKAKNKLEADFLRQLKSTQEKAEGLGHYEVTTGDFSNLFKVVDHYRTLTVEDIKKAARKYMTPQNRSVVIAVPKEKEAAK